MTLGDYLCDAQLSQQEFAVLVGTTQATVSRWVRSRRLPGIPQLSAIRRVTKGAVTADDFIDQFEATDA